MLFTTELSNLSTTYWSDLPGDSFSLAIAELYNTNEEPILIATPTIADSINLKESIKFFLAEQEKNDVYIFPDRETLPYDQLSPHKDITSLRLTALLSLPRKKKYICIASINTLLNRLPPSIFIEQNTFQISTGQKIDINNFKISLERIGYHNTHQVLEHGEYLVKGGIIDIFPMGHKRPFRIEFLDDEVESIRFFDPKTQLSIETVQNINLMPAAEYPLTNASVDYFKEKWKKSFNTNPKLCSIFQSIKDLIPAPGIEYYLPLFFEDTVSLFSYLPKNSIIIQTDDVYSAALDYSKQTTDRFMSVNVDKYRSILPPSEAFITPETLFQEMKQYHNIKLLKNENKSSQNFNCNELAEFHIDVHKEKPMDLLEKFISSSEHKILIVAESLGRQEIILSLLQQSNLYPDTAKNWQDFIVSTSKLSITTGKITNGAILNNECITIISENALFGYQNHITTTSTKNIIDSNLILKNLVELDVGALVVHIEHGISRYQGLKIINSKDIQTEFLCLEFFDNAIIYVPITSLNLITRYNGINPDNVSLSKLGTKQWIKIREEAIKQLKDVAAELLDIYAKRKTKQGIKFTIFHKEYLRFCSKFDFEETLDQTKAFKDIIDDMSSSKTMDRLICGDVGFGKTEVAMRAAFIVSSNNHQAAILVPTTLLATQHYQNFIDRFHGFNINIDCLSRFKTSAEKNVIKEKIKNGSIDIIIGTHSLLQDSVEFKSLGLLVIDEEHRFGVKQKEYIKSKRNTVDILSLTATPIPRTLNMSLQGIRDISILATPPMQRLSIKTFIQQKSNSIIREGIMRELLRGGQVFYLHNNVQTIPNTLQYLEKLIPEAKIKVAHGQLPEKELEQIMSDFYHGKFNILLCTTIIETGLDIPSTNTIVIDRADKFGLAQLYQLRGRVGRSHHQAYAYLMLPDKKLMTADAKKRIDALSSLNKLGAGFTLASYDLDIRGSGEILGQEQSGNIQKIGFSLYAELLEQTVKDIKNGKIDTSPLKIFESCEINLNIPALIPSDYIFNVKDRLVIYKRIANATSKNDLDNIRVELIDRFGVEPQEVKNLFSISKERQIAINLDIKKIDINHKGGYVLFNENPKINQHAILLLVTKQSDVYKLLGPNKLSVSLKLDSIESRFKFISNLFKIINTKI